MLAAAPAPTAKVHYLFAACPLLQHARHLILFSNSSQPYGAGNAFTANDALYFGATGTVLTKDNKAIAGATASSWPLYDTLIQGAHLTATLPLPATPPGTALSVVMYFAELYWAAAGARSCNWAFNGGPPALPAPLDVVAAAGARYTALQMPFQVGGA